MPAHSRSVPLDDYPNRAPGSDRYYQLIEEAVYLVAVVHDPSRAVLAIETAINGFVTLGDSHGEARAHAKAAIVFRKIGDPDHSAVEARRAMDLLRPGGDAVFFAIAALELGQVLESRRELDEAATVFSEAIDALKASVVSTAQITRLRAFLEDCAATVYNRRSDFAHATELRRSAIAAFETLELAHDAGIGWANFAFDQIELGDFDAAVGSLDAADRWAEALKDTTTEARRVRAQIAETRGYLATSSLERRPNVGTDTLAESRRQNRLARSIHDQLGDVDRALNVALNQARIEIKYGDVEEALALLAYASARVPPEDECRDDFTRGLRMRIDRLRFAALKGTPLARELAGIDHRPGVVMTAFESPFVPAGPPVAPVPDPEALLPFTWARLDVGRAILEIERRKSADLLDRVRATGSAADVALVSSPAPDGTSMAQPAERGEVFVDYYTGRTTLAFVQCAGEQPRGFELQVSSHEIAEAVSLLRRRFDGSRTRLGIDRLQPQRVSLDFLHDIGRRLLPFMSQAQQAGVLCIFPHGPLHNFPFHAVCDEQDDPLIAHAAICYSPSRQLLAALRARVAAGRPPASARHRAVAVSVPAADEPATLFEGDGAFLTSLGLEARSLESAAAATVPGVLQAMKMSDVAHFNCHGLFAPANPIDSALLLSNGHEGPRRTELLDATERAKHLTARLLLGESGGPETVVLRACSSGVTNVRAGDEQEGLVRGFLQMGASRCVVTRWKVDAESSRDLIRAMYRHWLTGPESVNLAVALQRAQLELLAGPAVHYRHPYHWAPFVAVGDWH